MNHPQRLKERVGGVDDLGGIASLGEGDQSVYLPRGRGGARADQLATLRRIQHEAFTSDAMGEALAAARGEVGGADPDSDDVRFIRVVGEDYERTRKLPAEFVAELARHVSLAHEAWLRARSDNDFSIFRPALETMIALKRRQAELLGPTDCLYDALLHEFEPFMKTAQVRAVFEGLKGEIVPLVHAISAKAAAVSDAPLRQAFDVSRQREFL